jgi:hypothetical protein
MGRLATLGAETNDTLLEGYTAVGALTMVTNIVRSGTRAFKADSGAGNAVAYIGIASGGAVQGYLRSYIYIPSASGLPTTTALIYTPAVSTTAGFGIKMTTTGTLQLFNLGTGTQIGSDSVALTTDAWHAVTMYSTTGVGATDEATLWLDEALVASATGLDTSFDGNQQLDGLGWRSAPGANKVMYIDDVTFNDETGADQNTIPPANKLVLLLPISDNARASLWTGGVGGTTSLFDAVNNTPPIGTATETNLTQIEHAGGAAGTTDAYDANMTSYATAGLVTGDTVNVVEFQEVDGEDIATGTKKLSFSVVSNPAIASPGQVSAGNDIGALGTYSSNWATRQGQGRTYNPSVTLATSPVMRVTRPETASRVASVCFMGIYVDYSPAVATTNKPRRTLLGVGV